jgi:hypothetical protein
VAKHHTSTALNARARAPGADRSIRSTKPKVPGSNPVGRVDHHAAFRLKAIGVSTNQVYSVANKLQKEGKLTKTAKGTYRVKQSAAKASK